MTERVEEADGIAAAHSFLEIMQTSADYVLAIQLISTCQEVLTGRARLQWTSRATAVLLSLTGPVIALVSLLLNRRTWNISLYYVATDAVLIYMLLQFPTTTWRSLVTIAPDLDAILPSESVRKELGVWLERRLDLRAQTRVSLVASFAGSAAAYLFLHHFAIPIATSCAYVVSTAIVSGLGANALWWLWAAPGLVRKFASLANPLLDWISPLDTAGIRLGRSLLIRSALRALAGTLMLLAPVGVTLIVRPLSSAILALVFFATTTSFITTAFILIMPQYWLIRIVDNFTRLARSELRSLLPLNPVAAANSEVENILTLYRWMEQRPTAIWDLQFLSALIIAALGAAASCIAAVVALSS